MQRCLLNVQHLIYSLQGEMNTAIRKLSYNGQSHQGANQAMLAMLHKRNIANVSQTQHTASLRLITPVCSGGKGQVPRNQNLTPLRACFQPQPQPCQVCPRQRHRLAFPLPFHQGGWESLGSAWLPTQGPCFFVFILCFLPACLYVHQCMPIAWAD